MKTILVVALTLTLATLALAEQSKSLYKVFRFNTSSVGISCASGQIPEVTPRGGRVQDGIVIVTCSQ